MTEDQRTDDSIDSIPADADAGDSAAADATNAAAADSVDDADAAAVADATNADTTAGDELDGAAAPAPPYGIGPFSVREVSIAGAWLVSFVVSFFSVSTVGFNSVWTSGLSWILTIGVPTVAVFLLVLRRLSPEGIRRVGSLGVDQFASVAFSVSAMVWLTWIWDTVSFVARGGGWVQSWVIWVSFAAMLAGVVFTVFARFIPPFADDFRDRPEVVAQPAARPVRAVTPRPPRPPREARPASATADADADFAPTSIYLDGDAATAVFGTGDAGVAEAAEPAASTDADATWAQPAASDGADEEPQAVRYQAFWALAPEERDVVDENGVPLFRIGPTAWALVIEDRGDTFVVRHEDGRVGYLHDVSGVTRG